MSQDVIPLCGGVEPPEKSPLAIADSNFVATTDCVSHPES